MKDIVSFGIVTISKRNAEGLRATIDSVLKQTYFDYKICIIISDMTSKDVEILNKIPSEDAVIVVDQDYSIYDAMNIGFYHLRNECSYHIYLNAGDFFFSNDVLFEVAKRIKSCEKQPDVVIGSTFISGGRRELSKKRAGTVYFPRLYMDYPIHQSIFFRSDHVRNQWYLTQLLFSADLLYIDTAMSYSSFTLECKDLVISSFNREGCSSMKENKLNRSKCHLKSSLIAIVTNGLNARRIVQLTIAFLLVMYYGLDKVMSRHK